MNDIKMSDVFDLPMHCGSSTDEIETSCTELGDANYWLVDFYGQEPIFDVEHSNAMATAAAHAINSHDKLTARKAELEAMSAEVISMLSSGKYKHNCSKIVGVIIKALKDNS